MSEIYTTIGINAIITVLVIIFCVLVINTLIRSFKIRKINIRMMKITGISEQNISAHTDYRII